MTGALLAMALALALWRRGRSRPGPGPGNQPPRRRRGRPGHALDARRMSRPAAVIAGACLALAVNPVVGLLVAFCLWWLLPALTDRLDTRREARLAQALSGQLPMAAGLLAACLSSGAALPVSLRVVADSMPEPARSVLAAAAGTAQLGGSAQDVADALSASRDPGWQAIAAAVVRSSRSGAPLADLLAQHSQDALGAWFASASVKARGVAVRSVLPLALCYLPAFFLLTVVPLVAGFLNGISLP